MVVVSDSKSSIAYFTVEPLSDVMSVAERDISGFPLAPQNKRLEKMPSYPTRGEGVRFVAVGDRLDRSKPSEKFFAMLMMGLMAIRAVCGTFALSIYICSVIRKNKHFVKCLESPQREPHQA
jgi:hypothetical protein